MFQLDKMHNQLKWFSGLKSKTSEVRQTEQIGQSISTGPRLSSGQTRLNDKKLAS